MGAGVSEFPDWMEDYFGLFFEPSYKQAQEINRAYRQAGAGQIIEESSEFTPEMWAYLTERIQAEKSAKDNG